MQNLSLYIYRIFGGILNDKVDDETRPKQTHRDRKQAAMLLLYFFCSMKIPLVSDHLAAAFLDFPFFSFYLSLFLPLLVFCFVQYFYR